MLRSLGNNVNSKILAKKIPSCIPCFYQLQYFLKNVKLITMEEKTTKSKLPIPHYVCTGG